MKSEGESDDNYGIQRYETPAKKGCVGAYGSLRFRGRSKRGSSWYGVPKGGGPWEDLRRVEQKNLGQQVKSSSF